MRRNPSAPAAGCWAQQELDELVEMGFPESQARQALDQVKGDTAAERKRKAALILS